MGTPESFEHAINELTKKAKQQEAPADVRAFARRMRMLYISMLQEGFQITEISQIFCMPLIMHLNPLNTDFNAEN